MTRKSVYTFVGLLALAAQGASAAHPDRAAVAAYRAAHPRTPVAMRTAQTRVHSADGNPLYAVQCFADYGDLEGWYGAVKVVNGPVVPEAVQGFDSMPFQGAYMDGKLLVVFHNPFYQEYGEPDLTVTYKVYDTDSWECESSADYQATDAYALPYGLAYDHTTDKVYGSFYADGSLFTDSEDAAFGYIDLTDTANPVKIVAELPERMRALTFDKDGNLFGITYGGDLYTINKLTGDAKTTGLTVELPTAEGDASFPSTAYGRESMCCDWSTGDFYITYGDDFWDTYVTRFSPLTGEAEIVADYSYSDFGTGDANVLTALSFRQRADNEGKIVPAAPADFTVTPVGTELKVTVAFTLPSVDTNGDRIDADMTWTVTDGVSEPVSGTAHSGETVNATIDSRAGIINFAVSATLDGETSKSATASAFVGCDTPVIAGLPTVRVNGQRLSVAWNAAQAANGGNLDPVTYIVTRMPDNIVVNEACASAGFVDVIESDLKTLYYYLIQPVAGTVAGETVESRSVYAGTYFSLPLSEYFDDEKRFLEYPVIDGNNDGNIWEYSTKYEGVAVYPGTSTPADDYLLIGPFKLEQNMSYSFGMSADGHSGREKIAVYVGTDPSDVSSFSHELVAPTVLDPSQGRKSFEAIFTPAASGDYYFGIQACTPGVSQFIYVYEVEISAAPSVITAVGAEGNDAVAVSSSRGAICVSGFTGEVTVITTTGLCVARAEAAGRVEIPVAAGVYVVHAGDTTAKVAVR